MRAPLKAAEFLHESDGVLYRLEPCPADVAVKGIAALQVNVICVKKKCFRESSLMHRLQRRSISGSQRQR